MKNVTFTRKSGECIIIFHGLFLVPQKLFLQFISVNLLQNVKLQKKAAHLQKILQGKKTNFKIKIIILRFISDRKIAFFYRCFLTVDTICLTKNKADFYALDAMPGSL